MKGKQSLKKKDSGKRPQIKGCVISSNLTLQTGVQLFLGVLRISLTDQRLACQRSRAEGEARMTDMILGRGSRDRRDEKELPSSATDHVCTWLGSSSTWNTDNHCQYGRQIMEVPPLQGDAELE